MHIRLRADVNQGAHPVRAFHKTLPLRSPPRSDQHELDNQSHTLFAATIVRHPATIHSSKIHTKYPHLTHERDAVEVEGLGALLRRPEFHESVLVVHTARHHRVAGRRVEANLRAIDVQRTQRRRGATPS